MSVQFIEFSLMEHIYTVNTKIKKQHWNFIFVIFCLAVCVLSCQKLPEDKTVSCTSPLSF